MDEAQRKQIVSSLKVAFGGAKDVTPADGQSLHVLLPRLRVPKPWLPSPTRAMTVWANWPSERPLFYVDEDLLNNEGQPPRNPTSYLIGGESWRGFSFGFPWEGRDDPVLAIQRWVTRFEEAT